MPLIKRKLPSGKVRVSEPGGRVISKGTSMKNANSQIRLLNAIKHGFVPDKKRKK